MELVEEYRLSEYQDFGMLTDKEQVHIVRNRVNGQIAVRKIVSSDRLQIYAFLQKNPNPFLPVIYECIQQKDELIVIEEYLTGKNLGEWVKDHSFSENEVVRIGIDLCNAMKPLHHANPPIICRDLKPENVIITLDGRLKVVDFDIARTYQMGQSKDTVMMGTQGYAAPEQFGFGQSDARTDIYGIGALLNYLLIQQFPAERIAEGKLHEIISCCTKLEPNARFQSVEALENALCTLIDTIEMDVSAVKTDIMDHRNSIGENSHKTCGYHIPGFRSKNPWKMIGALLGYGFITWFCFTLEFTATDGTLYDTKVQWIDRICIWITQLVFVFLVCDYRGIKSKIPLLNSERRVIRMVGYFVLEFVMFFAAAILCAILELLIE